MYPSACNLYIRGGSNEREEKEKEKTLEISVTVDELDISDIFVGQNCEVTFDAISSKSFTGSVNEIGISGSDEGGNAKYIVTIIMDREDNMLSGMNVHIIFSFDEKEGVMTIPESALYEEDKYMFIPAMTAVKMS